mmetsp:Transcript_183447/g.581835  ORF Transcript_183447/g.581835 Transcript_183447/m.581835 type:complete len:211 (+) Transcript_183447:2235-2867(+)
MRVVSFVSRSLFLPCVRGALCAFAFDTRTMSTLATSGFGLDSRGSSRASRTLVCVPMHFVRSTIARSIILLIITIIIIMNNTRRVHANHCVMIVILLANCLVLLNFAFGCRMMLLRRLTLRAVAKMKGTPRAAVAVPRQPIKSAWMQWQTALMPYPCGLRPRCHIRSTVRHQPHRPYGAQKIQENASTSCTNTSPRLTSSGQAAGSGSLL